MTKSANLSFHPMRTEDFALMTDWLNRPHVKAFYQKDWTELGDVEKKYGPRVEGSEPVLAYIASADDHPIGYIQSYLNRDWPNYSSQIGTNEGVGLDFFIGEQNYLRQGFGRKMELMFLDAVAFPKLHETVCYLGHEPKNIAAIKCSESAGFVYVHDAFENEVPVRIYRIDADTVRKQLHG